MGTTRRQATTGLPEQLPDPVDGDPPRTDGAEIQNTSATDGDPDEARRRRIAERAYRRAEDRGFAPGRELDDWLAAEDDEREGAQKTAKLLQDAP